jgi:hypothetical protein
MVKIKFDRAVDPPERDYTLDLNTTAALAKFRESSNLLGTGIVDRRIFDLTFIRIGAFLLQFRKKYLIRRKMEKWTKTMLDSSNRELCTDFNNNIIPKSISDALNQLVIASQ